MYDMIRDIEYSRKKKNTQEVQKNVQFGAFAEINMAKN